jgi:hypothetical protein
LFGSSGSFTELLFTGIMCWCGSSESLTELHLTGNICWCESGDSFTELLYTVNMCGCGEVFHLRRCYSQETCVDI